MRTSNQDSISPHVSNGERKAIHRRRTIGHCSYVEAERKPRSVTPDTSVEMGMSPGSSSKGGSVAMSNTEYSTAFFPEATFRISPQIAHKKRTEDDKLELLERIERILRFAQKRLKKSKVEAFFEKKRKKNGGDPDGGIIHVQHSDVQLDSILGNGSYNVVYSVRRIKGRLFNPKEIVVKTLRSKLLTDLPMLAACAADLRKEGLLLAALQQRQPLLGASMNHPHHGANHIVKCLAWAPTGLSAFANGCHDSFFLVLERLDRTLTDSIKEWKTLQKDEARTEGSFRKSFRRNSKSGRSRLINSTESSLFKGEGSQLDARERDESSSSSDSNNSNSNPILFGTDPEQIRFWKLRLELLMDLCGAVAFLHSQRVIHRDLKPDNVGFDLAGRLKVFDFDVARVLPSQANWNESRNETFKMTKKVGSPRYMSPEVARGEYYNEKSDVYALGLLSYEILSLKRPFESLSSSDRNGKGGNVYKDCVQVVVKGGVEETTSHEEEEDGGNKRRQKRRNSFAAFGKRSNEGTGGSSGKLSLFRRRSHSRGSSGKSANANANANNRRSAPKYANVRPLLPIATPQEIAARYQQQQQSEYKAAACAAGLCTAPPPPPKPLSPRGSSNKGGRSKSNKSTSLESVNNTSPSHYHAINDVGAETGSFFWTRSIRTTIDRAWSYDIPTRPSASELKVLVGEELERIEWYEEDYSFGSCSTSNY